MRRSFDGLALLCAACACCAQLASADEYHTCEKTAQGAAADNDCSGADGATLCHSLESKGCTWVFAPCAKECDCAHIDNPSLEVNLNCEPCIKKLEGVPAISTDDFLENRKCVCNPQYQQKDPKDSEKKLPPPNKYCDPEWTSKADHRPTGFGKCVGGCKMKPTREECLGANEGVKKASEAIKVWCVTDRTCLDGPTTAARKSGKCSQDGTLQWVPPKMTSKQVDKQKAEAEQKAHDKHNEEEKHKKNMAEQKNQAELDHAKNQAELEAKMREATIEKLKKQASEKDTKKEDEETAKLAADKLEAEEKFAQSQQEKTTELEKHEAQIKLREKETKSEEEQLADMHKQAQTVENDLAKDAEALAQAQEKIKIKKKNVQETHDKHAVEAKDETASTLDFSPAVTTSSPNLNKDHTATQFCVTIEKAVNLKTCDSEDDAAQNTEAEPEVNWVKMLNSVVEKAGSEKGSGPAEKKDPVDGLNPEWKPDGSRKCITLTSDRERVETVAVAFKVVDTSAMNSTMGHCTFYDFGADITDSKTCQLKRPDGSPAGTLHFKISAPQVNEDMPKLNFTTGPCQSECECELLDSAMDVVKHYRAAINVARKCPGCMNKLRSRSNVKHVSTMPWRISRFIKERRAFCLVKPTEQQAALDSGHPSWADLTKDEQGKVMKGTDDAVFEAVWERMIFRHPDMTNETAKQRFKYLKHLSLTEIFKKYEATKENCTHQYNLKELDMNSQSENKSAHGPARVGEPEVCKDFKSLFQTYKPKTTTGCPAQPRFCCDVTSGFGCMGNKCKATGCQYYAAAGMCLNKYVEGPKVIKCVNIIAHSSGDHKAQERCTAEKHLCMWHRVLKKCLRNYKIRQNFLK